MTESALFESTGILEKDYTAYCEISNCAERDEIIDGIYFEERGENDAVKITTNIFVRDLEWCLHKRDMEPLTNAIPHCQNLFRIRFTSAGVTETSFRLLVQAVWRSPSVMSVWLDFNPGGLFPDPKLPPPQHNKSMSQFNKSVSTTISALLQQVDVDDEDDEREILLYPSEARGAAIAREIEEKGSRADLDKAARASRDPKKGGQQAGTKGSVPHTDTTLAEEEGQKEKGITIPASMHALLLTHIQDLSLRGNSITDSQVLSLSECLETNTHLLSLNLWGNDISDRGATYLAHALRINKRLTAVDLGKNNIGDAGAQALAGCLKPVIVDAAEFLSFRGKLRSCYEHLLPEDPPSYPVLEDLLRAKQEGEGNSSRGDPKEKKAAQQTKAPQKQPQKKAPGQAEPTARPPNFFDREVVRLTEADGLAGAYIMPGNTQLWSLNLSENSAMTAAAVRAFILIVDPQEWELLPSNVPASAIPVTPRDMDHDKDKKTNDKKSNAKRGMSGRKGSTSPRSPRTPPAEHRTGGTGPSRANDKSDADKDHQADTPLGTPTSQQPVPKLTAVLTVLHHNPHMQNLHWCGLERLVVSNENTRKHQAIATLKELFAAWLEKKQQAKKAELKAKEEEAAAQPTKKKE